MHNIIITVLAPGKSSWIRHDPNFNLNTSEVFIKPINVSGGVAPNLHFQYKLSDIINTAAIHYFPFHSVVVSVAVIIHQVTFSRANKMFRQSLLLAWTHITVEPYLFFYTTGLTLSELAQQNLVAEKTCRVNAGFNNTVCDALSKRDLSEFH